MMSSRGGGGRRGREVFLSAHRCPEVVLPHHHNSRLSAEFTCTRPSEADYLDVSSNVHSEEEECISDWSEEDLSLYFSPSVILPSDDEDSGPESDFRCVDVAVETQMTGQGGEGLKMVPKRQIHLKKKNKTKEINDKVILKNEPFEGGAANRDVSTNELFYPTVHHRPDLLLRQHSMPTSFHTRSMTCGDVDSCGVYRGLVAGASPGLLIGGQSVVQRRLQKSVSLDETKTKMASCIIKSVLSKKMQVEKINTKTSYLKKKHAASPIVPSEGGGLEAGPGVFKAPVHSVRDVRSLVKNTYSLSFSTATTPDKLKPAKFKVVSQEDSPPPTYQQAVGVKGHSTRGHVSKVTASFSQSRDRKQYNALSHPITQQRQGSEPIISRRKDDFMFLDPPPSTSATISQLERADGASHQAGASLPFSAPPSPSSSTHPQVDQQEQRPPQGASSHSVPAPLQRLQTCFYTPSQHPQLRKVSYIPNPLNSIQNPHLHQSRSPGDTSDQTMKSCPSPATRRTADHNVSAVTPPTLKNKQQQPFLCSFQSFLPAQVSNDFLIDITGSAVTPGAVFSGPAPCHVMLEPNGRYCYVDTHPQHHRKMLLDPETGQFIQVFLPGASPAPNTMFPMCCFNPAPTVINPTPTILQTSSVNRAVLSVMRFQPTLYAAPCLPVPLHTHTSP
ncbi:uncharacterized protein LOC117774669 isoform X1 [Hippoglossus hippoglossus]|uniref:uncharacterized protein LOC117774669 isoform X1 n=1 Tax=Hippoglossus hippoglossus TaxID=8267 RepID=UPI00148D4653|nr:uncharacterized protein LOC117774669 isoform X1 [Hippoglossus hippoglossus]